MLFKGALLKKMDITNKEFKRKFSFSFHKNLRMKLAEMTFTKDFVNDTRGDLYPLVYKSEGCVERVLENGYEVKSGEAERIVCELFPYATYELEFVRGGHVGLGFILPTAKASVFVNDGRLFFSCGDEQSCELPDYLSECVRMLVSLRPGAFDVYFMQNGAARFFTTFKSAAFSSSHSYAVFTKSKVSLTARSGARVTRLSSFIDNGVSIADMRPIRYENGEVMVELGRVYFTATIRMEEEAFQGVFSWVPSTAEIELCGAIFYDSGDGLWCGDLAASVLYHREKRLWYLWVCSFAHEHILGHSIFDGDVRFGVNVVDIELMKKADDPMRITEFSGFSGDEDPDFFYDESEGRWLMAVCRLDSQTRKYRYVFFESDEPFSGYRYIGAGLDGAETGGSFVRVDGEVFFVCGNDFNLKSNYRIYGKHGMVNAKFDYPDGGFRGWGTLMPIKTGSRTRYFWLTFDRHLGSGYNWSYGNLYCFEAY